MSRFQYIWSCSLWEVWFQWRQQIHWIGRISGVSKWHGCLLSFFPNCIVNRMAKYLWLHYALGRTTRKGTGSVFRTLGFTSCVLPHWPSRSGNIALLSSWHKGTHHGLSERWEGPVQGSLFCFLVPESDWAEWRTLVARMHVYCVLR